MKLHKCHKLLAFVLALCLFIGMLPMSASAYDTSGTCGDSLTWRFQNGTLTVSGTGPMTNWTDTAERPWNSQVANRTTSIVIEDGVTAVGDLAFNSFFQLTSCTVAGSVTSLGEYSFSESPKLRSLSLKDGLKTIGRNAFRNCTALTSVTLPGSITNISGSGGDFGGSVFEHSGLTTLTLLPGITEINDFAFIGLEKLASVTLPNTLTKIGASAFEGCPNLSITLPAGVTALGQDAFWKSGGVNVSPDNLTYSSENGVLFNKNKSELLHYPVGKTEESYIVPQGVKQLSRGAFVGSSHLQSVRLPEGITTIAYAAFDRCTDLAVVELPSNVKSLEDYAFSECESLAGISFPASLETIGEHAFYKCGSVTDLDLSQTVVKTIGRFAFDLCSAVQKITLPASLTNWDRPESNTCESLEEYEVAPENTVLSTVDGVLYNKDKKTLLAYPPAKPAASFTVPATVTAIDSFTTIRSNPFLETIHVQEGNTVFYETDGMLCSKNSFDDSRTLQVCPGKKAGMVTIPADISNISAYFGSLITGFVVPPESESYFSQDGLLYEKTHGLTDQYLLRCPSTKPGIISVADGTKTFNRDAFEGCTELTEISLPSSILDYQDFGIIFSNCTSLTGLEVRSTGTATDQIKSFDDGLYTADGQKLLYVLFSKTEYEVAQGTVSIDYNALLDSHSLEYIVIPASVTQINGLIGGSSETRVIIYGESGSAAETYARRWNYTFRPGTPEDYKLVPKWDSVKVQSSAAFGNANKGLAILPSSGTATDGKITVSGTYSVQDADVIQEVGSRSVRVQFTVTTAGDYKGMTFTKDYPVTITKRPVTVTMDNKTRKYGEANPPLTYRVTGGVSQADGSDNNLTVTPSCAATKSSPAGTPVDITATAVSNNYAVTIAPGKLTITKADITGITTAAPTGAILANDSRNTDSTALKAAISLPSTVSVSYKDGKESLPIVWGNAAEKFNARGGVYTYRGTVTPGTNFNAYSKTLTATLTVTPVTGTISQVNGQAATSISPVTVAKSAAQNAASYEALGLPASIQLTFDNGVLPQTFSDLTYSVTLAALKNKGVNSTTDITVTSIPAWVTITQSALTTQVKITDKFPVKVNVSQTGWTYGAAPQEPVASQTDAGNGTEAHEAWSYLYTGTTAGGKAYRSEEKPTEAGSYTVTATLISDTFAGSGAADFAIAPLALQDSMIAAIDPVTFNGKSQTPALTVKNGQTALKADTDYTVEYTNNINAGSSAKVTVTGTGNYQSTASKTFTISPMDISSANITLEGKGIVNGILLASVEGLPTPLPENGYEWYMGGVKNDNRLCYQLLDDTFKNNVVTVKAVGSGNYTGSTSLSHEIAIEKQQVLGTVGIFESAEHRDGMVAAGDEIGAETGMIYPNGLTFSYQWLRNGAPIESAVNRTYTLQAEDNGQHISVEVYPPADYQGVLTSDTITVGESFLAGILSITPTDSLIPGQNLTVSEITGGQELTEGTDYIWQWYRNDEAISAATSSEYTLTAADVGKIISVNMIGQRDYEGTITCGISVPSAAPAIPTINATAGNGKISLAMNGAENGVPSLYELQLLDSDGNQLAARFTLNGSYTWDGLTNGTSYQIRAAAITVAGKSGASQPVTVTPKNSSSGGGSQPVEPDEPEQPDNEPVSETVVSPDGTETTTTTWPDGKKAEAVKTPEGDKTILVTTPEGEKLADIAIPSQPGEAKSFEDVKEGSWYKESVDITSGLGLFNGTDEKSFSPSQSLTRGMLVTTLYRLSGAPEYGTDSNAFPDVKDGAWYGAAANWANAAGIASGTGTGFEPNTNITREQLVTMIYRYTQTIGAGSKKSGDITAFPDHGKVSDYAKEAMSWAIGEGLIQGKDGILAPGSTATRAEVATVLSRLVALLTK